MKGKKNIFDAVDLMTEEVAMAAGVQQIPIEKIRAFRDHPFRLYEGERLNDMVESIREHGVLVPVIVRKMGVGYEMLAGHNRLNAARIAGLSDLPAIVKENLSDEEAYVYVIETNVMQRSFADLLPSEKAAVLQMHYEKMCCQGRRNDIIRELEEMNGIMTQETFGHNGHKSRSRDTVAEEYGFSSRNAARFLRLNYLVGFFKDMIDEGKLALLSAVDISYLSEKQQEFVFEEMERRKIKIRPKLAEALRRHEGELDHETFGRILDEVNKSKKEGLSIKISEDVLSKYFEGMSKTQMEAVVAQALAAWYEKEVA